MLSIRFNKFQFRDSIKKNSSRGREMCKWWFCQITIGVSTNFQGNMTNILMLHSVPAYCWRVYPYWAWQSRQFMGKYILFREDRWPSETFPFFQCRSMLILRKLLPFVARVTVTWWMVDRATLSIYMNISTSHGPKSVLDIEVLGTQ